MSATDRLTLDYVYPRLYQALPAMGDSQALPSAADNPVLRPLGRSSRHVRLRLGHAFSIGSRTRSDTAGSHRRGTTSTLAGEFARLESRGSGPLRRALLHAQRRWKLRSDLLLLPEIWQSVQPMVSGTIVAAVPARDVLFFTGDADKENLAELRRWTSQMIEQADKPLSRAFLRWENERWVEHTGFAA